MPNYQYECNVCGAKQEQTLSITDYVDCHLKGDPCFLAYCPGRYEQLVSTGVSFSFKGGAPTPKFHRKADQG